MSGNDRSGDSGVTLIEMIVATALLALVLGIVGTLFVNVSRTTGDARSTRAAMGIARTTMYEIQRVVRVATDNPVAGGGTDPAIVAGTSIFFNVYADTDVNTTATPSTTTPSPAPTQVSFSVSATGNLVETRVPGSWDGSYWTFAGSGTTRVLPGPLVVSATPLFVYLDVSGNAVTPAATGLTAAQRASVASIRVTTTVATTSQRGVSDPVVLTDTVGMTNLLAGVS